MSVVAVLLTVWCEECNAQNQDRPGKLGQVVLTDKGSRRWIVTDRRGGRRLGRSRKEIAGAYLTHSKCSLVDVPEMLPAFCERHGWGNVAAADVTTVRARNLVLALR